MTPTEEKTSRLVRAVFALLGGFDPKSSEARTLTTLIEADPNLQRIIGMCQALLTEIRNLASSEDWEGPSSIARGVIGEDYLLQELPHCHPTSPASSPATRLKQIPPSPGEESLTHWRPGSPISSFVQQYDLQGLRWEEVVVEVLDDETIEVKTRKLPRKRFHFAAFGLADGRTGNTPNLLWHTLLIFAANGGTLPSFGDQKKSVSRLRKHLCGFFGIPENPFYPFARMEYESRVMNYQVRFTLTDLRKAVRREISPPQ